MSTRNGVKALDANGFRQVPPLQGSNIGVQMAKRSRVSCLAETRNRRGLVKNKQVVLDFFAAMEKNEKKGILSFFDDSSVFNNIPMGIVTGANGIWQVLGPLHDIAKSVEYVVHGIAESDDGKVLTERTDRYTLEDRVVEFHVMGIFEVEGEVIKHWRDYFDLKQSLDQMPSDTELPI